MLGYPCTSIRPHSITSAIHRSGNTPQVGVVVGHPSLCPIKHLGCFGTGGGKIIDKREQWFMTFREICHLSRPVVHLGIDIDGVFTVPRGIHTAIPHSLQVGCLSSWLRRGNKQITAILIEQGYEIEVVAMVKVLDTHISLCLRSLGHRNVEFHTVKLLTILFHMSGKELIIRFLQGFLHHLLTTLGGIARHIMIVDKVGSTYNINSSSCSVIDS